MNIRKLLATTAIVALAATSVQAKIAIVQGDSDGTAANSINAQETLFNELSLTSGLALIAPFEFVTSFLPANVGAGAYNFKVTLPAGMTLGGNLVAPATNIINGAGGSTSEVGVATIVAGGGVGGSTVTFLLPGVTNLTTTVNMSLPIAVSSCSTSGLVTIDMTNQVSGAAADGGTATIAAAAVKCVSGLDTEDVAGNTTLGADVSGTSLLGIASGYTLFKDGSTGKSDVIGTVNANLTTNGADRLSVSSAGAGQATTGLVAGDLSKAAFSVQFADMTGIDSVTIDFDGAGGTTQTVLASAAVGTAFPFVIPTANMTLFTNNTPDNIIANVGGGTAPLPVIMDQSLSVADATITLNAASTNGTALQTSQAGPSGGINSIARDGTSYGTYKWVGDATKGSRNLFRFTGAKADTTSGEVTFSNSSTGKNGTFAYTLNTANGEGQVDSIALDALNPGFGRADVSFFFFSAGPTNANRLLLRGDVLSSFGAVGGAQNN
jgi:hypothetical protein